MTADVELLPLPEWLLEAFSDPTIERLCDYARANVAHATAAQAAEIEALRAEREVIGAEAMKYAGKSGRLGAKVERLQAELDNRWATGVHTCHDKCQRIACVLRRQRDFELKRAERLAEALREARDMVEDWAVYASEYFQNKHDLQGDLAKLDAALRDHDQEVGNG